jgi:membrane-associated phospholipid phosphatase
MLLKCSRELKLIRLDVAGAARYMRHWLCDYAPYVLVGLSVSLLAIWAFHRLDEPVIAATAVLRKSAPQATLLARWFSYLGDFLGFNLIIFVVLRSSGRLLQSRRLARLAVASLLCGCLSGATANLIRSGLGRPRPCTALVDGLYGPSLHGDMHSLPSAHTATAFGAALPLLSNIPTLGVPLTFFAGGVAWSRLQLDRHHLTDVLLSVLLASLFSLPLSHWAMRGRRRSLVVRPEALALPVPHALTASRQPH